MGRRHIDARGKIFGFLTPVEWVRRRDEVSGWRCRCTCGEHVIVPTRDLRRGDRKACGINGHKYRAVRSLGTTAIHKTEYSRWHDMRRRCTDPKNKSYKNYGGRGISVCERWRNFAMFLLDMGKCPGPVYTLERINNNGNYEPTNCRWATRKEQARNWRHSLKVELNGKTLSVAELAESFKIDLSVVHGRLKMGWAPLECFTTPVRPQKKRRKRLRKTKAAAIVVFPTTEK